MNSLDLTCPIFILASDVTISILIESYNDFKKSIKEISSVFHLKNENTDFALFFDEDYIKENMTLSQINKYYINIKMGDDDYISFNNTGLYPFELKIINELDFKSVYDFLDIDEDTELIFYNSLNNSIFTYYYDFRGLIDKILNTFNVYLLEEQSLYEEDYELLKSIYPNNYNNGINFKGGLRNIEIIQAREKDKTLEEIGAEFGLTRERVRQIENLFKKSQSMRIEKHLKKLLLRYKTIPVQFLNKNIGFKLYINSNSNVVIDDDMNYAIDKDLHDNIKTQIDKIKSLTQINQVLSNIEERTQINLKHYVAYALDNSHDFLPNRTAREIGESYLKKVGLQGYNINEYTDEIVNYFKDRTDSINPTHRNIQAYITDSGKALLYKKGTYIHEDFVTEEQKNLAEKILTNLYVPPSGYPTKSLFQKNKKDCLSVGISNYSFLYGIIKNFYLERFNLKSTGRGMRLYSKTSGVDRDFLLNYVVQNDGIVNYDQAQKELKFSDATFQNMSGLSKYDSEHIVALKWLEIDGKDKVKLKNIINEEITNKEFCHAKDIYDKIFYDEEHNKFLETNKIYDNMSRLIYYLEYMFSGEYYFCKFTNSISLLDNKKQSYNDILVAHFSGKKFTYKELNLTFINYGIKSDMVKAVFRRDYIETVGNDKYIIKNDRILSFDQDNLLEILDAIAIEHKNQTIIDYQDIILTMKINKIESQLSANIDKLLMLIESHSCHWSRIKNDLRVQNANVNLILLNIKKHPNIKRDVSNVFKIIIQENLPSGFYTFNQINDHLMRYEYIKKPFRDNVLKNIYEEHLEGNLIKVGD